MSCEACREAFLIDKAEPDCWDGKCRIPPLDDAGTRIMDLRDKLFNLRELTGPDAILRIYEVTKDDLDLLEFVEGMIKELKPSANPDAPQQ